MKRRKKLKNRLKSWKIYLNLTDNFKINDSYYDTIRQLLSTDKYNFRLPCSGLSCTPRMTVYINISNLKICQVCSYISRASIKLETINNDIYHRKLWEVSKNFIHKRLNAIKKYCIDCDIVGICRGSCIMNGLDIDNHLNKAACLYQQEMWKVFLNYMYKNELKVDEIN
jgi:radical SAM protein with 4Fe4S-binding SPASM domain